MHVFIYPSKKKDTPKKKHHQTKEKEINIKFTTRNVNVNLHVISEIILMVE